MNGEEHKTNEKTKTRSRTKSVKKTQVSQPKTNVQETVEIIDDDTVMAPIEEPTKEQHPPTEQPVEQTKPPTEQTTVTLVEEAKEPEPPVTISTEQPKAPPEQREKRVAILTEEPNVTAEPLAIDQENQNIIINVPLLTVCTSQQTQQVEKMDVIQTEKLVTFSLH